ncbi:cyclic di-GMP-binding protein [Burkholderiales bacterium GJ-E10]|nr:cyclic di-GMP-binding protein [Burkholderiales bacterium GJ-E10]
MVEAAVGQRERGQRTECGEGRDQAGGTQIGGGGSGQHRRGDSIVRLRFRGAYRDLCADAESDHMLWVENGCDFQAARPHRGAAAKNGRAKHTFPSENACVSWRFA